MITVKDLKLSCFSLDAAKQSVIQDTPSFAITKCSTTYIIPKLTLAFYITLLFIFLFKYFLTYNNFSMLFIELF